MQEGSHLVTLYNRPPLRPTKIGAIKFYPGAIVSEWLEESAQRLAAERDGPTGWCHARHRAGKLSGESFRDAGAVVLEYMAGSDPVARLEEVRERADKVLEGCFDIAAYTSTRHGLATHTIINWLSAPVDAGGYSRIAAVLAARLNIYDGTSGLIAHTHLYHVTTRTTFEHTGGLPLNPDNFIRQTENEAQELNWLKYEGPRPITKSEGEEWSAAEPGLFEGLGR